MYSGEVTWMDQRLGRLHTIAMTLGVVVSSACGNPVTKAPAAPEPTIDDTAPAASSVEVDLTRTASGLTARYRFPAPVRSFAFAADGNVRRDGWTLAAPSTATLDGSEVRAEAPAVDFEFLIAPDPKEHDRVYPTLTPVGEGHVLYGPALFVRGLETSLVFDVAPGLAVRPTEHAINGYVFVGSEALIERRDGFELIGSETVAPWLAGAIAQEVNASLAYYAERLGLDVATPTIFMTDDSPGPMPFHGDVTSNGIIFLRFFGDRWTESDPDASREVAKFVRHEAFHLWNRGGAPENPPWLHEGGAEYAAILAATKAGVLTEAQALEQVSFHTNRCRGALGSRPLSELAPTGAGVYNCGVMLQWLADLHVRRSSSQQHDIFTLWHDLLGGAGEGGYTADEFLAAAGPLVALIDAGSRWVELGAMLAEYGVSTNATPTGEDDRSVLVRHLLTVVCGQAKVGFWTEDGYVRLDTDDTCGPLSGHPEIVAIEGHDLFKAPAQALAATQRKCHEQGAVSVTRRDSAVLEVPCPTPASLRSVLRITAAPDLGPAL